jgi:hypothetical protein
MSNEAKPSHEQNEQAARETLEVTVSAQVDIRKPVDPESITLNNSVLRVVWRCPDLPSGASLQIIFEGDERGPFFSLESTGTEVIGSGNRGPEDTEERYSYEAMVQSGAGMQSAGKGRLKNHATRPIFTTSPDPTHPPD